MAPFKTLATTGIYHPSHNGWLENSDNSDILTNTNQILEDYFNAALHRQEVAAKNGSATWCKNVILPDSTEQKRLRLETNPPKSIGDIICHMCRHDTEYKYIT